VDFQPMSPEEVQRTVQFLLHQQAQFSADLAALAAGQARSEARLDKVADGLIGLTGIVGQMVDSVSHVVDSVSHVVDSVSQIADAQKRTDEQLRATDAKLGELSGHIDTVESHLDLVIQMFEQHLREDHGHPPS
jgi:ABC-type transporter Mla subunit MlaD